MGRTLRVYWAYLVRDALMSASYRLAFAIQIFSLALSVVSIYFVSKLVGAQGTIDRYGGYLPFAVVGFAMASYFTTGFGSFAGSIRSEQLMGTLESLLMTPARLRDLVIASSIWNFIWTTLSAILTIAAAWVFFGVHLKGNYLMAFLLLALTTITFSCLGIVSASYIMIFKRGDPLKFLVGTLSFLLGGVIFPVDILPAWLRKLSMLLPITHGLEGIRDLLLAGESVRAVLPQLGILIAFVAVGLPISLWCFRKSIDIARREGSLVHY